MAIATIQASEHGQMMATLRKEALEDAEKYGSKQRFALFSQPPSLAIGDDKQYEKVLHPRNEDGKPTTENKNILVSAPSQGKVKSSYFSVQGYTTIGDLYLDPDTVRKRQELEKMKLQSQEQAFKPASLYKNITNSIYKHEAEDVFKKKNYTDVDGKVITEQPNVKTNPENKELNKRLPHMTEPYDRIRQLRIKEMEDHHKKMGEKPPFRTTVFGKNNFNNTRRVFGEEGCKINKRPQTAPKFNLFKHDAPFKPSNPGKQGYNGTLQKFPEYKPDPLKMLTRIDKPKEKDPFKQDELLRERKMNCGELTRPTSSISCNPLNIRKDMMLGRVRF